MGQLGTRLKQARLDQGLSLEQLNERTKIQKHHLEGIESGDYSAIPGAFYVRAFIKRYAQAVGLDGDALLLEHKSELPEDEAEAVPAEHLTRRPEKKKLSSGSGPMAESMPKLLMALFIIFILLIIWYFYLLSTSGNDVEPADEGGGVEYEAPAEEELEEQPEQADEEAGEEEQAAEPEEQQEPEEPAAELELEGVSGETTTYNFTGPTDKELKFTATGDSWLSVISDGGSELLSLARVFGAGETETVDVSDETSVFMRIGDYAMLKIELNGEQVPYEQERKPQNIVIRFDDAE